MLAAAFRKTLFGDQPVSWAEAFIVSSIAIVAVVPMIAGLYLLKSVMGINLMDGPSPLHDFLYHFVR